MKRIGKVGEGILLGGILAVMVTGTLVYTTIEKTSSTEIVPVHSVDIVITPRPKININTADAETISTLSGIGEVIAERIVERRSENGPFASIDDLLEIPGIGEAKLEDIREEICLN